MAKKISKPAATRKPVNVAQAPQEVIIPPMVVTFNKTPHTLDKAEIVRRVEAFSKVKPPTPTGGQHKAMLPSVAWPVSLGWAIQALTGVQPQGISANGNYKGAYHPQQAMAFLSKLTPYGVKVETSSPNMRYAAYGPNAAQALDAFKRSQQEAAAHIAPPPPPTPQMEVKPTNTRKPTPTNGKGKGKRK